MKRMESPWGYTWQSMGGYDCMTGAMIITAKDGRTVVEIDAKHYGDEHCGRSDDYIPTEELQEITRLVTIAPDMADVLEQIRSALDAVVMAGNISMCLDAGLKVVNLLGLIQDVKPRAPK